MNLETVLACAQTTARQQLASLGCVDADVQTLIDEVASLLAPDSVVEEAAPVVEEAAPVVEEAAPVVEEAAPVVEETPAPTEE
jgi:starch synthase